MHGTHIGALVFFFLFHAGMQVQDILPGSPRRTKSVETSEAKLFSTIEGQKACEMSKIGYLSCLAA